jgi:hypothetical protein
LSSTAVGTSTQFIYNNAGSYASAADLTYVSSKIGIGVGTAVTKAHIFTSTATDGLTIENTNAGASGALLNLYHNSAFPAAADDTGIIRFTAKSSTGAVKTFGQIKQRTVVSTNGSEESSLVFGGFVNGSFSESVTIGNVNGSWALNSVSIGTNVIYPVGVSNISVLFPGVATRFTIGRLGETLLNASGHTNYDVRVNGSDAYSLFVQASSSRVAIGTGSPAGKLHVNNNSAVNPVTVIQGALSQSGNMLEFRDNTGAILRKFDNVGKLSFDTDDTTSWDTVNPTTVNEAIDRLAVAVSGLLGTTIP